MGTPLPPPQKGCGAAPQFSADVFCGQTAGWMKLVLGMMVGLSPGDFVLNGDPAPPKGAEPPSPVFGQFLLWPNGWMHQDATWYGCRPQPRGLFVRWRPSPIAKKGAEPPKFYNMAQSLFVCSSSSSSTLCVLFLEKKISLIVLSRFQYKC